MAYISSTVSYRPASLKVANRNGQTGMLSNRYAKPLEQTTSEQHFGSGKPEKVGLTYTNLAQGADRGRSEISSLKTDRDPTRSSTDQQVSHFDSIGSVKALIAHYQGADELGDAETHWSKYALLDPATGQKRFVNDDKINQPSRPQTGELFKLTLKTKEGDSITFAISVDTLYEFEGGTALPVLDTEFLFTVAGSLSDEERDAVDGLVDRLGGMAKDYQKHGWTSIDFLDTFENGSLAGFNLDVQGDNGHALIVSYDRDAATNTHALEVMQNGYRYEVSAESNMAQSGFPLQDNLLYQQYQQLIVDTARSYKAGEFLGGVSSSKSAEFFLDGLETILSPLDFGASVGNTTSSSISESRLDRIHGERRAEPPGKTITGSFGAPAYQPTENSFLSGLADFSANFSSPRLSPNESNSGEVSQMSLSLSQTTDVTLDRGDGEKSLRQSYSYESRVSQHFGIGGDSIEHANLNGVEEPGGQTYLYEVVNRSVTLARSMTLNRDRQIIGYEEEKDAAHSKTTKEVVNGNVECSVVEDLSDPGDIYAVNLQMLDESIGLGAHTQLLKGYRDIQILEEAVRSQHIDLYS